jgi:lysophospholipase L1-like esterase
VAKYVYTLNAVTPGLSVRLDTASGSTTPATIYPLDYGSPIPGAVIRSDSATGAFPQVESDTATLYQKTLDAAGAVTATATLTGAVQATGDPDGGAGLAASAAFTGAYAKLTRPPTFVSLGDSTSAVPGAGVTYPELLAAVTDRKFRLIYNAGISGNTTAQMLARIQADVIAKAPSYCIVLGGTNDIGGSVAPATTRANLTAIYDALLAAGIAPITATITPRNANADVAGVRDLNNWIRGNSAIRGLHCIDINAALVDPDTSFYTSGLNADTIHPNPAGAVAMANAAKALLTSLGAPQPPSLLPIEWSQTAWSGGGGYSKQFCVNPLMLDTNSDGTPDSWSLSTGGSGTITRSVVTDSRFVGRAMKWVCTSSNAFHTMQQGLDSSSYAVGDKIRLYVRVAVESTSGISGSNGFIAKLFAAGANQSAYAIQQWSAAVNNGVFTGRHDRPRRYDLTVGAA